MFKKRKSELDKRMEELNKAKRLRIERAGCEAKVKAVDVLMQFGTCPESVLEEYLRCVGRVACITEEIDQILHRS